MKFSFSLFILFISLSLLLLPSNSFTTATIRNETTLSIVAEDHALIAITYLNNNMLTLTNNTGNTIGIDRIEVINKTGHELIPEKENDSHYVQPGGVKQFTITGDPKNLTGLVIQIKTHWKGGRADIKSTIPAFDEEK
ncbi:MAG: hypothetical protein K6T88_12625 [Bacillus sp. (in: Bacteria)]|nr:hypothetical protein [Bacillus sp. (in: firmicutes)]